MQKRQFSKQDWHSDYFGLRNPVIQNKKLAEKCYLYRRTRFWHKYDGGA